jgi:MscS family membrane protein
MIYLTHPFSIGDWVNLPEKSIEGHVEEIGWYMTRIRTFEKRPIYIPNSLFSKMVVVNPSRMTHRQFKEIIGIRYSDLGLAKGIILDIKDMILSHSDVDPILPTIVRLTSFGDYSVDILVSAYIRPTDTDGFSRAKEDIFFKIADIIKQHGADFAYPTSTIEIAKALPVGNPPPEGALTALDS